MKIAVWHNLPSGGGKRALFDHVSGLIVRGHEVEVWAPPTADREYLPLSSIVREHIVALDHRWKWTGAERLQLALYKERQIRAMDEHCAQCAQEMDEGGFDLLFANSCQFYRTTSIGRFSKLPTILYLQEPFRWLYEATPGNRWAARSGDRGHGWQAVKRAFADWREVRNARVQVREEITNAKAFDRILCNSYFSRESILRAYGVDARVCYLGINTKLFRPRGAPRGHVIGLGSFTREKGLELCIRAIARISPRRPPLVWVGNHVDQAYFDEVRKLAAELDVAFEPRVLVADDELLDLLSSASAMVYAPRLEPFGLAPLEAGACEVPVVAVAEGGVRETVQDGINGLLVDANPAALADAITHILEDPILARRLGTGGHAKVKSFWSTEAATGRLIEAFEDTLVASQQNHKGIPKELHR